MKEKRIVKNIVDDAIGANNRSVNSPERSEQKLLPSDSSDGSSQVNALDMWLDSEDAFHALAMKSLSRRESEVLLWLARGKTNSEIGMILHISPRTVSKHLEHIYSKLGVECRTAAVVHLMDIIQECQKMRIVERENLHSTNGMGRILLVDDDQTSREVLRAMFEQCGYACEEVENGFEALTWLQTDQVDLIITDNKMPGLGGLEFLKRFVTRSKGQGPPVIVHSGNVSEEMGEKAFKDGAYAVLHKPCSLSEVLSAAARAINHGRSSTFN